MAELTPKKGYQIALERIRESKHKSAKELNLADLCLEILPPELWGLTELTSLYLGGSHSQNFNRLTTLPSEIGQLTNLTLLDISGPYANSFSIGNGFFTSLPSEIGALTKLTSLRLNNNYISYLPAEIGQLTNLTSLDIYVNELKSLPPEIGKLTKLTRLDAISNHFTSLPSEIGQLIHLTLLQLDNNQLSELPPEIGQLTALTSLYLSNNSLTSLPPEIGQLARLELLILSNREIMIDMDGCITPGKNKIKSLPPEILNLKTLKDLDLRGNPLSIPAKILGQTNAQTIFNYLARRPASLLITGQLKQGGIGPKEETNPPQAYPNTVADITQLLKNKLIEALQEKNNSIPHGFEAEAMEVDELVSRRLKDPTVYESLVVVLERISSRLSVKDNSAFHANTLVLLGNTYCELRTNDRTANLLKAVDLYRQARNIVNPKLTPQFYASVLHALGNVYSELTTGDQADNLLLAIEHLQEAESFCDPEEDPNLYAQIQIGLGTGYNNLPIRDKKINTKLAIDYFQRAQKYCSPKNSPTIYSTLMNNLGNTFANSIYGDRDENLAQAIDSYKKALSCFPNTDPFDHARTYTNLGRAYTLLSTGNKAENILAAIDYYKKALDIQAPNTAPRDYAMTQNNLGLAYFMLPAGNRQKNLNDAVDCFKRALEIYTPDADPLKCRTASFALGKVLSELGLWEQAYIHFRNAILAANELFSSSKWVENEWADAETNSVLKLYENMVTVCLHLLMDADKRRDALIFAEAGKARIFLDLLGNTEIPQPPDVQSSLITHEASLISQLRETELSLSSAASSSRFERELIDRRKHLKHELESLWKNLETTYPSAREYLALRRNEILKWSDIQSLSSNLGNDTAVIEFFNVDNGIAIFILRNDWQQPEILFLNIPQDRLRYRYLLPYAEEIFDKRLSIKPSHNWLELGEELLAPLEDYLQGMKLVYFIPHGWLHLLPIHALNINGEPFIQHHAAAYSPSAAVLQRIRASNNSVSKIDSPLVMGFTPDSKPDEQNYFLDEARAIANHFGGDALINRMPHLKIYRYFPKKPIWYIYPAMDTLTRWIL